MKNISHRTQKSISHLTGKFTSRLYGFMFDGKKDKKSEESSNKKTNLSEAKTASKVPALEQSNQLSDTLLKIYGLMQATNETNKSLREKQNNFKEENALEDEKRHQKLLKAIQDALSSKKGKITETAAKETPTGSILESIFSTVGGISTILSMAKFFVASPLGISLLLGAPLLMKLAQDKNPEETNKMIQGAMGGPSTEAAAIVESIEGTSDVQRRKQNVLADRPSAKKSYFNPKKDAELQTKYLEEIGFDDNTGLTKAERDQGFTGLDQNGKPVKKQTTKATAVTKPTEAPKNITAPVSTPSMAPSPSIGTKLNEVQTESNDIKIKEMVAPSIKTINNTIATSTSKTSEVNQRTSVPNVRNTEETFQQMIYYSTRVV